MYINVAGTIVHVENSGITSASFLSSISSLLLFDSRWTPPQFSSSWQRSSLHTVSTPLSSSDRKLLLLRSRTRLLLLWPAEELMPPERLYQRDARLFSFALTIFASFLPSTLTGVPSILPAWTLGFSIQSWKLTRICSVSPDASR